MIKQHFLFAFLGSHRLPLLHSVSSTSRGRMLAKVRRKAHASSSHRDGGVFVQKLNVLSGESEWVLVGEGGGGEEHHLVFTSYLDMLNDKARNKAFDMAIQKAIRGPCHVLEIGAGTGLLSMMTARALEKFSLPGGKVPKVSACEAFLPMFLLARKVLRRNEMSSKVHLVYKRSNDIEIEIDIPCRADLLVMEIFDSQLLGEGLIPTLRHAHRMLLKPDACTIPYSATIYGQFIKCDYFWRVNNLQGIEGLLMDGLVLAPQGCQKKISPRPVQHALHVDALNGNLKMVSEPFEVFTFNFSQALDDFGRVDIKVENPEAMFPDAIISWWVLQFDREGTIFYSTAPKWIEKADTLKQRSGDCCWRDHWKQCVWFLPFQSQSIQPSQQFLLRGTYDQSSLRYDLGSGSHSCNFPDIGGHNSAEVGLYVKPERILLLGSEIWRATIIKVVKKALEGRLSPLCLVIDDSIPLTVAAAKYCSSSDVVAMLPGLGFDGLKFVQTLAEANQFSADRVKVLCKKASELISADLGGKKIDIVFAEPYYMALENMLPWQNLRFWKEITDINNLLNKEAITIPCEGILCGMAVFLPDLWHSRHCVSDLAGFDHSSVNAALGACGGHTCDGPILPYDLWQCGDLKELTEPFSIMKFNLHKAIHTMKGSIKVPILKSGLCHAIVLWIDWVMDAEDRLMVSTGPSGHAATSWKQGIKLLASPVLVADARQCESSSLNYPCMLVLTGLFDSCNGRLELDVNFESLGAAPISDSGCSKILKQCGTNI